MLSQHVWRVVIITPQHAANMNLVDRSHKQVSSLQIYITLARSRSTSKPDLQSTFKLTPHRNIWWWNRKQNDGRQEGVRGEKDKWREPSMHALPLKNPTGFVPLTTACPVGSSGKLLRYAGISPEWTGIFHSWLCHSQMCRASRHNARPGGYDETIMILFVIASSFLNKKELPHQFCSFSTMQP